MGDGHSGALEHVIFRCNKCNSQHFHNIIKNSVSTQLVGHWLSGRSIYY